MVGNAKNAGKTTVLNTLIAAYANVKIGVTSIGLDGEELDAVTYLPKPRIFLSAGTLAATAEDCLKSAEATYRIIRRTGVSTALGEIVVVEIVDPGICLVGGPATVVAMEQIVANPQGARRRQGFYRRRVCAQFACRGRTGSGLCGRGP